MDGTFKVIKAPFTQLYSVQAFVKQNGDIKQVPLVFILMSGKRKRDYRRVLKAVQNILPDHTELQWGRVGLRVGRVGLKYWVELVSGLS